MELNTIGKIITNAHINSWFDSELIKIPYFAKEKLRFIIEDIEDDSNKEDFETAISNFLSLTVKNREFSTKYVYKNYCDFIEEVGEDDLDFHVTEPAEIWNFVKPEEIHVSRRVYGDRKVYISIIATCEWEIEHGLQIVYREGKQLNRVSQQDGHLTYCDAYDLPEESDRIC